MFFTHNCASPIGKVYIYTLKTFKRKGKHLNDFVIFPKNLKIEKNGKASYFTVNILKKAKQHQVLGTSINEYRYRCRHIR